MEDTGGAGRPSTYSLEAAVIICTEISTSAKSLKTICMEDEFLPDVATVYRWLASNDEFCELYARAQDARADYLAEEILEIADDSSQDTIKMDLGDGLEIEKENREWINRAKLRVDARKWVASKLKPKKYGDRLDVTSKNEQIKNSDPAVLSAIAAKLNK